jgi:hypothetical protein
MMAANFSQAGTAKSSVGMWAKAKNLGLVRLCGLLGNVGKLWAQWRQSVGSNVRVEKNHSHRVFVSSFLSFATPAPAHHPFAAHAAVSLPSPYSGKNRREVACHARA